MAADLISRARRAAQELAATWPGLKPSECARRLGIDIAASPSPPPAQPELRSEYAADPPRITLYARSLRARPPEMRTTEGEATSRSFLAELHVAHELFHHLEMTGRFGSLTRVESEEGAHAFARCLAQVALSQDVRPG